MTDENWKFNDIKEDPQGSTDDIVQCLRHPFPIGISTPSTSMKGAYMDSKECEVLSAVTDI